MNLLQTKIDLTSQLYMKNRADILHLVEGFRNIEEGVRVSEEKAQSKFENRGQILPRERLNLLLDKETDFLEICSLAGYRMHDDRDGSGAGGNLIAGIGFISRVRCMVMISNSAIKGGTISPMGLKKTLRCQRIALENKLPIVFLVESGGANLLFQSEIFTQGGRGFANQARLSASGIPQITVVHGSSTAGGAYIPGLSDYVVMVRNQAKVFLGGPPLVKAAIGETATEEELGGANMHAGISGTAEYIAQDDNEAILTARRILAALDWNKNIKIKELPKYKNPVYDSEELAGIVPIDFKVRFDVREVIARIADGSKFLEFKREYDNYTICGHACFESITCGIIGNNGPLTPQGSVKAAQFIQLCCQSSIPIVYLQNTTGYMVGTRAEQSGIVKHGSKMLQAVANANVPQITFIIGGSFGAGNYGMCGRGLDPRFIFAWPNSRVAVMGGEQAAKVMSTITRAKLKRAGKDIDEDDLTAMEQKICLRMNEESSAIFATARLWDDGIIDPRDTRKVLCTVLSVCLEGDARKLNSTTFGVARM